MDGGGKRDGRAGPRRGERVVSGAGNARSGRSGAAAIVPSGAQFEIAHGQQRATIVEVGAGVREYAAAGRPVLDPYPLEAISDGARGAPLIPWPNRLADGRYRFDGVDHQLALSEPERHNAIHGLMRWRPWTALERDPGRVLMGARLFALPGYPFNLELRIAYELSDAGLTVTTTATNVGQSACPYGAGQHPYISPGQGPIDDCLLQVPAATRILTDGERQLPCGREALAGGDHDFRSPRRVGDQRLDDPFTDLARDGEGNATVTLTPPDGGRVQLWMDQRYRFVELFSGDTLAPERRRRGLAVEPMTCAPNGFQSGDGLVRLEPGESFTSRWGVRLA
jgi:aldose 1-epimerase